MKRNKIERAEAHEHSTAPSDADGFARDAAHDGENTFENRLTERDRILAKQMGISLE